MLVGRIHGYLDVSKQHRSQFGRELGKGESSVVPQKDVPRASLLNKRSGRTASSETKRVWVASTVWDDGDDQKPTTARRKPKPWEQRALQESVARD